MDPSSTVPTSSGKPTREMHSATSTSELPLSSRNSRQPASSHAKAAEKRLRGVRMREERPAGAEAHPVSISFAARLKSRPFTELSKVSSEMSFFAACLVPELFIIYSANLATDVFSVPKLVSAKLFNAAPPAMVSDCATKSIFVVVPVPLSRVTAALGA